MRLYDLSPPITPDLAVFPGDTPPSREVLFDRKRGDPLTLSTLRTTVHAGTHVDAPSHYGTDAPSIERVELSRLIGRCQVVRVDVPGAARFGADAIDVPITEERVLFATETHRDRSRFDGDFAALEPELVTFLHESGVQLVGIDTPSVDLADSKDLPAHQRFLEHDMLILEGVVLTNVPAGVYELIALPLRLVGFDGSPVRAVLRELP